WGPASGAGGLSMPPERKRSIRTAAFALGVVVLLGGVGYLALRPVPAPPIVGMVRTTEIRIEPEVSGRVATLPVAAGDGGAVGTVVAQPSTPEPAAAVEEAEAVVGQAAAARARVYAGVRHEEVDIAAREVDKAQSNLVLAQQQFTRISTLTSHG